MRPIQQILFNYSYFKSEGTGILDKKLFKNLTQLVFFRRQFIDDAVFTFPLK